MISNSMASPRLHKHSHVTLPPIIIKHFLVNLTKFLRHCSSKGVYTQEFKAGGGRTQKCFGTRHTGTFTQQAELSHHCEMRVKAEQLLLVNSTYYPPYLKMKRPHKVQSNDQATEYNSLLNFQT